MTRARVDRLLEAALCRLVTTASFFDREATVGLSGGFGSVNAGRQNMLGVNSIGWLTLLVSAHAGTNPNVVYSALNSGAAVWRLWDQRWRY